MSFTADIIVGRAPLEIVFTDTTAGTIISRYWTFGDGAASEDDTPVHTYREEGVYTVQLVVTYSDYTQDTFTLARYIRIDDPLETISEECLRFATEDNEGQGWSTFGGTHFVSPMENHGAFQVLDSNKSPRSIVIDRTDFRVYEIDTFDRVLNTKPSPVDKESVQDAEIAWNKREGEATFGPTSEYKYVSHEKTYLGIREDNSDNRGADGYTATGQRDAQELSLSAYINGEQVESSATAEDTPEAGEIVFSGRQVKDNRIQMVVSGTASEIKVLKHIHKFLGSDESVETAKKTMTEHTLQGELAQDMVLHVCRSFAALLNRATGVLMTGGGTVSKTTGPDGRASAILCTDTIIGNNVDVSTDYTVIIWIKSGSGISGVTGMTQYSVAVGDWAMWYKKDSDGLAANLQITAGEYIVRVYNKQVSDAAIELFYNDIVDFEGRMTLPGF